MKDRRNIGDDSQDVRISERKKVLLQLNQQHGVRDANQRGKDTRKRKDTKEIRERVDNSER